MDNFKSIINRIGNRVKRCYEAANKKSPYMEPAIIISGSLLVVLIVIMSVLAVTKQEIIAIETNKAEVEFYNSNYDQAIVEYEKLKEGEEWPFYQVKIAEIYSIKGELNRSNEILKEAVLKRDTLLLSQNGEKYKEQDKEFINYVVFTYFMNGEYEEAISLGEEYIKMSGEDKALMRTMYTVYMVSGQKDKAIEIINTYDAYLESAYDLAVLAEMNILTENFDSALNLLNEAFNKDENEIKSFDVIEEAATYDREVLISKLTELVESKPKEISYKMWLAKIYSMSLETTELANEIIKEIEIENSEIINNLQFKVIKSSIYKNMGNKSKADDVLADIINEEENSFDKYYVEARKRFEGGDYNNAFEFCKKSILANRNYPNNYGILIPEIMMATDKGQTSEAYFRTALQKEPFNYNIIVKAAEYYTDRTIGNEKATEYYKLALSLKPNDAEMYYNLANLDLLGLLDENIDSAIENLNKAIELDGNVSKYHRALGVIYLNKGEDEKAIESIRNAYSINKDDLLVLNNAGCYYITVEGDIERGMENIKAAYDGITNSMDEETKNLIIENYDKVKKVYDEYILGNRSELEITDFKLFY